MVVEKIKVKKGEFWYNFRNVGKLIFRDCMPETLIEEATGTFYGILGQMASI